MKHALVLALVYALRSCYPEWPLEPYVGCIDNPFAQQCPSPTRCLYEPTRFAPTARPVFVCNRECERDSDCPTTTSDAGTPVACRRTTGQSRCYLQCARPSDCWFGGRCVSLDGNPTRVCVPDNTPIAPLPDARAPTPRDGFTSCSPAENTCRVGACVEAFNSVSGLPVARTFCLPSCGVGDAPCPRDTVRDETSTCIAVELGAQCYAQCERSSCPEGLLCTLHAASGARLCLPPDR